MVEKQNIWQKKLPNTILANLHDGEGVILFEIVVQTKSSAPHH